MSLSFIFMIKVNAMTPFWLNSNHKTANRIGVIIICYEQKIKQLLQYRFLELELARIAGQLHIWEARAINISPNYRITPKGTGEQDEISSCIEHITQLQMDQYQQMIALVTAKRTIERAIRSLTDDRLRLVLHYKYIDGLTLQLIADKMHYCLNQIKKYHKHAIELIWRTEE